MIKSKLQLSLGTFAVAAVMALAPGSALAADSSLGTYAGAGGGSFNQVDPGADPGADPGSADPASGSLPFTGLDVGLALGGGLLLLGTGMAIGRVVVRDNEA